MITSLYLPDEQATLSLGAALAKAVCPGDIIFLQGNLGAGKTTLVRGFLRALGHAGAVKSPTYTLVESYTLAHTDIYHFDLYRIVDPYELELMGFREYFHPQAICLLEWPNKAGDFAPVPTLTITIQPKDAGRELELNGADSTLQTIVENLA